MKTIIKKKRITGSSSFCCGDLKDQFGSENVVPITAKIGNGMLEIGIKGYGDMTSRNGKGTPILIEQREGKAFLVVWGDINQEDPTHVIDLSGAMEDRRLPEDSFIGNT